MSNLRFRDDETGEETDLGDILDKAAARRQTDSILASIMRDIIKDDDFYFELESSGYTHIDGHLDLTPEQMVAVEDVLREQRKP